MSNTEALRVAAQQALETLEQLQGGCTDSGDGTVEAITVWCPEVIDALRAALAQPAASGEPVHQWRKAYCADWYDGYPDNEDGGGPYETRTLYTAQPAPAPALVPPDLLLVAIGTLAHDRMGGCPDAVEGWHVRDPQCAACRAILAAEAISGTPAKAAPHE